ncbi:hypothetical protein A3H65_04165 [Candidatus Giovannonibacteria bacterium RIFCSPLOWO2_02_FULL_45_14]|uniref:Aminoglycoside phosphotransferase domain-containing protein n=1 Tax=Candidatus Giovannonibacteria bacterium RIFCSPLOWO2_12_FULL_44_15 TaxID=1798364 RepID=A0A1F5XYM0_9BACT|nr:MAG: hypothetical protein A3C75_03795 [Candidatus Giovannonibacteria bacterium RIFCSPHIGHO2_02_FULL_44_31]OGF77045.1 MAG: hypothetical protein A3E62_02400 [Candidatus Giovannonibacteria bacterium RIFCSPHIGHO2_12_FULL_44_29]OGF91256.1 MAG: hypothetical protein A3H65_04165 [Candidatus Giovannonibacteria bacterium RIFCSPLOWO2_02_FULL_45_14]OGF92996.1 MAG: hypothetical protein A3G54_01975 [Candidatus Giovannonibacteria bacterium RIFCSPLOWO2_12_FULL_44_15]
MFVKTEPIELAKVSEADEKKIFDLLEKHYEIKFIHGSLEKFLEKTAASKVYRADAETLGKLVIKNSFWRDAADSYEKAYQISEALRERDVAIPKVFLSRSKSYTVSTDLGLVNILEFVAGDHFTAGEEEFISAGKALGIFHHAGKKYLDKYPDQGAAINKVIPVQMPYEESREIYWQIKRDLLSHKACAFPKVCEALKNNLSDLERAMEFIDNSGVNSRERLSGIIHNDFHTNNALFKKDGSFAAFLDIDQVGVGPFVWDLGNTLASFASNFLQKGTQEEFGKMVSLFLEAYRKEFILPDGEYKLCLAGALRWDMMRLLRSLRRHLYENDRFPELILKIEERLISRIKALPGIFSFLE